MKASQIDNRQEELFQPRLSGQLNQKNELLILSRMIPWDDLEIEFADLYQSNSSVGGQPPKPIRLMIGLLLLQHLHNLSDEQVVRGWVENPYWQHFCGYDFLQWEFPINPSSLTRFRQRLGSVRLEKILSLTIAVAVKSEAVKVKDLKKVIVDTTVMPKNIEFPTDSQLYNKARERLVKLAAKNGIALRQNYNLITKTLLRKISGYLHAKQMKRARKAIKHLKTIVGRVVRDVERKIGSSKNLAEIFTPMLDQTKRLLAQERKDKNKLYSLHGTVGDQLNALLTGVGHNLRLILNHIRKLLKLKKLRNFVIQILLHLLEIFLLKIYRLSGPVANQLSEKSEPLIYRGSSSLKMVRNGDLRQSLSRC